MQIEITKADENALREAQTLASELESAVKRWAKSTLELLQGPPDSVSFAREAPENARKLRQAIDAIDPSKLILKTAQRGAGAIARELGAPLKKIISLLERGEAPGDVIKPLRDGAAWLEAFNAFIGEMSEAAAEAGQRVAKAVPGGGVHAHVLRDGETPDPKKLDGGHVHVIRLDDGTLALTGRDGSHGHYDGIDQLSGHHKHEFKLPDGKAVGTLDDGDHMHEADEGGARTTYGGLHDHEIEIDGKRYRTLMPETMIDADTIGKRRGPWSQYGGSAHYASRIVGRFPQHKTYVEPFMGAASCLFTKEKSEREILNDINDEAVFVMRYLKAWSDEKEKALKKFDWTANKETFDRLKKLEPKSDHERVWKFFYLRRYSFSGSGGFSAKRGKHTISVDKIARYKERLANVKIEHGDYAKVIEKYDGPDTFFFIDPPYPGEWAEGGRLPGHGARFFDFEKLASVVSKIKGSFLIVYGDTKEQRKALASVRGRRFSLRVNEGRQGGGTSDVPRRYFIASEPSTRKADDEETIQKIKVAEIEPGTLRHVSDRELRSVNLRLHQLYGANFADNDKITAGELNREDLINAAIFVFREMHRRGFHIQRDSKLWRETERLRAEKRATAQTHSSGEKTGKRIVFNDVVRHYAKPILLRSPVVSIVGGLANTGETENDIDILVHGPVDEKLRRVIEFRLGRALPPELSQRAQFHDESLGGPFTDHAKLYDLALVPRDDQRTIVEMAELQKQGDPLADYPKTAGAKPGVIQLHTRGKSAHFDFRARINDHLVGFTLFANKPGVVKDINTVAQARAVYAGYSASDGNKYLKPIKAPSHMGGTPKSRQPLVWLGIEGRVFESGEVGATTNETGVMVAVARPQVEWGLQLLRFHEFFLTGDQQWQGSFYLRMLVGRGGSDEEQDAGRRTPEGEVFWQAHLGKTLLPTVLKTRTVRREHMPPLGISAIPKTLEAATPKEFHYWEAKTEKEAKETRDALVKERFFTDDNVKIVNGKYQRIVRKSFLYVADGDDPVERLRKIDHATCTHRRTAIKQIEKRKRSASERGNMYRSHKCGYPVQFQKTGKANGPKCGEQATTAIIWADGRAMFTVCDEHIAAGEKLLKKINGDWAEIIGRRKLPMTDEEGIAWWHRDMRGKAWHREKYPAQYKARSVVAPGKRFTPMKPGGEFLDLDLLLEKWAIDDVLKAGVYVEPKFNGYRVIASRDESKPKGERVSIFFEDSKDERRVSLPSLAKALESVSGSWTIDGELLDYDAKGKPRARSDLARFTTGKPQDDSGAAISVFRVLYRDGEDLTNENETEHEKTLAKFFGGKQKIASNRLLRVNSKRVVTEKDLRHMFEWARKVPGSEGAVFKLPDAKYAVGEKPQSWAKVKATRQIDAIVYAKDKVSGSDKTFVYSCAVGPVKESDGYVETVEIDGKLYTVIGRTGNTNVQAKIGDVIRVQVFELAVDRREEKRRVHWFGPPMVEQVHDDKTRPMTAETVERMATETEIRKMIDRALDVRMPIVKTKEERFVLGIVLEPNDGDDGAPVDPDTQGDIYSAYEIRRAAHLFMEQYRNLGLMHRRIVPSTKLRILESYIAPVEFAVRSNGEVIGTADVKPGEKVQIVRRGTWLLAMRVVDDQLWRAIKSGKLTGLSIGGSARRVAERKILTQDSASM